MSKRAALVALAGLATAAQAQVTNVSQTREVFADTGFAVGQSRTTTAVGMWNESIEVNDLPAFESHGIASQDSSISGLRFAAMGTAYAEDDGLSASGFARTSFSAIFDVDADTPYTFVGSWSTSAFNFGLFPSCSMTLERLSPDPAVFYFSEYSEDFSTGIVVWNGSVDLAGTLTPGQYRVATNVGIGANLDPGYVNGTARFNIDLRVPSPGVIPAIAILGLATRRRRA